MSRGTLGAYPPAMAIGGWAKRVQAGCARRATAPLGGSDRSPPVDRIAPRNGDPAPAIPPVATLYRAIWQVFTFHCAPGAARWEQQLFLLARASPARPAVRSRPHNCLGRCKVSIQKCIHHAASGWAPKTQVTVDLTFHWELGRVVPIPGYGYRESHRDSDRARAVATPALLPAREGHLGHPQPSEPPSSASCPCSTNAPAHSIRLS